MWPRRAGSTAGPSDCAWDNSPSPPIFETSTRGDRMSLSAGKTKHMNALSNSAGVIAAAAMDQRGSLKKGIAGAKGIPQDQVTAQQMEEFKTAVTSVLTPHASAILL